MRLKAFLAAILVPLAAFAAEPPPPLPEADPGTEELGPDVEIIQRGEDTIEEYRMDGQVVMVRITPDNGYPYYLIDSDGDGELETFRSDLDDPTIQQWILFRW